MRVLGIETSCDETAAAVLEFRNGFFRILSSTVASSVDLQARYGGIVPEVAARAQMEYILPVLEQVLGQEYNNYDIDYIAVVNGPGLITSLRVGVEAARTLSCIWNKPLIGVNHLEGHIYSALLEMKQNKFQLPITDCQLNSKLQNTNIKFNKLQGIKFPAMALVVSGGHTELVLMKDYGSYKIIGQTLDDAVGEAFDKVAKILNLGYPGGPIISRLAMEGEKNAYDLPRPMMQSGDYNFSFSGLKTAVLYKIKNKKLKTKDKQDLCASFQAACVEVLVNKTIKAAEKYKIKTILLGGGVAANKELREGLKKEVDRVNFSYKEGEAIQLLMPELKYTGDNAVMIALAGYFKIKNTRIQEYKNNNINGWQKVQVDPNLRLSWFVAGDK